MKKKSTGEYKVVLREEGSLDGNYILLEAYINNAGNLVLAGHDLGDLVEKTWGNSDYEYWLTVEKADLPKVLLELIKERVESDVKFKEWLESKGIKSRFNNWA